MCGVRGEIVRVGDIADYRAREDGDRAADADEREGEGKTGGTGEVEVGRERGDGEEMARLALLVPNIELATGCSPAHLPGGPPSVLAQTLTQRILTLLHISNLVKMQGMRIWHRPPSLDDHTATERGITVQEEGEDASVRVKAFWVLYIDVLFISLDGNAFDAAWLAILAALNSTKLPKAWWDADREMVLCSDAVTESVPLQLRGLPVPLSFGVFSGKGEGSEEGGKWLLCDLDGFEEGVVREVGTVVVGGEGRVVRFEKSGGEGVGVRELRGLAEIAGRRREEWMGVLGLGKG